MKDRCGNSSNYDYANYGQRGIKYQDSWEKFENFYEDMGPRPEGTTLERIDVNGSYCKENCRWATYQDQNFNCRTPVDHPTGIRGVAVTEYNTFRVTLGSKLLGCFKTLDEAVEVRIKAEKESGLEVFNLKYPKDQGNEDASEIV